MKGLASDSSSNLRVGIVLVNGFTMLAFAGLLDTLRLASDARDRSRQRLCRWLVMSSDGSPVASSSGIVVKPNSSFVDPSSFHYLAVVGGVLHVVAPDTVKIVQYTQHAAAMNVALIGVCTGSFILARAGLMKGRRACVSWLHFEEFTTEFPELSATSAEQFLVDGDRITCPGGTSAIHLASYLVDRHCGRGWAKKGLRIMLEDTQRFPTTPQPSPPVGLMLSLPDVKIQKALLTMEQRLDQSFDICAVARHIGSTPRSLQRRFARSLGMTPGAAFALLRMNAVRQLVIGSHFSLREIADQYGFSSASQLARRFREIFNESPIEARRRNAP